MKKLNRLIDLECLNNKTFGDISLIESLQKNIELTKYQKLNLTKIETQLIYSYTSSNSYWINSELRKFGQNKCECKSKVSNLINLGLSKIPSFSSEIVYRMEPDNIYETKEVKDWYNNNIGRKIFAPFFLSTSKENWKNREIIIKINTSPKSKGRNLSEIGIDTSEKEVLFNTNTFFEIINVNEKYIELNEVSEPYNSYINWKYS